MSDEKASESGPAPEQSAANPTDDTKAEAASEEQANPALAVITAFGGIRPMAGKLEVAVSTVQGWKERGVIPANRHEQIRAAAKQHDIDLDPALLSDSDDSGDDSGAESADEPAESADEPAESATPDSPDSPDSTETPASEASDTEAPAGVTPANLPPPSQSRPSGQGWVTPFVLGAVVMGVGAIAAVLTVDLWGPRGGGGTDNSDKLTALESQVSDLSSALDQLKTSDGSAELVTRIDKLASSESDLTARIKKLEDTASRPAASADELADLSKSSKDLAGQMTALQSKLADLERLDKEVTALSSSLDAKRALAAGEVAKLLAVERLRTALEGSASYSVALDHLKTSVGADPAIDKLLGPLEAHAAQGLPSLAELRLRFPAVAKAIVAAGDGEADEEGTLSGVWERLRNVVSVRPVGPAEGGSPGAIAARAEVALQAGDLPGAISQLETLSGKAVGAAADWLDQAKARAAAEDALAQVSDQLVVQMTTAGG